LEGRRNLSFSSRRFRNAFLFSEIIIKLNVNLITSNKLSDIGESWRGAASPGWQGPKDRALGDKLNILIFCTQQFHSYSVKYKGTQ